MNHLSGRLPRRRIGYTLDKRSRVLRPILFYFIFKRRPSGTRLSPRTAYWRPLLGVEELCSATILTILFLYPLMFQPSGPLSAV